MLCIVLLSITLDPLITQAGHCYQRTGACNVQISPQVKGHSIQIHGVHWSEEIAVVNAGDFGRILCGEILAVFQVPEWGLGCIRRTGFCFACGRIHTVHIPLPGHIIHHIQLVVLPIPGHGNQRRIQILLSAPGRLGQVPMKERVVAFLIPERTLQRNLYGFYGHRTGSGEVWVPHGGGSDHRCSSCHAGNHTIFIHRGNFRIGRAPGDTPIR